MSSSERLEPLEALEKDYYLDERGGWYSDGEQRDSDSSDDEMREELSKLAGVRCESKKGAQHKKVTKPKDEFESDMDDELDESFVAHASKMFASPSKGAVAVTSESKKSSTDDEIPALVGDTDDDDDGMEVENSSSTAVHRKDNLSIDGNPSRSDIPSSLQNKNSSDKAKKSVTFANDINANKSSEGSKTSSFDDENNLLRKAVNKATETTKKETAEFYDSDEDDDNERWVRHHREQLKIVKPRPSSPSESESKEKTKIDQDSETDAVLSCPACMSLLTRDCQRHDLYHNQYRAIFVENCDVVKNEVLFLPQTGKNKRRTKKDTAGIKPNTAIADPADVAKIPKEDLFHPVRCSICSTNVGVYDHEEVFHFFNVLSGYA